MLNYTACKDCNKRHFACHDRCEDYLDFKRKCSEITKKRQEFLEHERYFIGKMHENNIKAWGKPGTKKENEW